MQGEGNAVSSAAFVGPLACWLEDLILRDACKPHKRNNVDTDLTWFVAPLDCTAGAPCGMIAPLPSIHGIYNIKLVLSVLHRKSKPQPKR